MASKRKHKKNRQITFPSDQLVGILTGLAAILVCFRRVGLTNLFGDSGSAYYMAAFFLFFLLFSVTGLGSYYAVSSMVRARIERENVGSARQLVSRAAFSGAFVSIIAAVIGYFLSELLCTVILHVPLAALAWKAFLPALLPLAVFSVLTGGMDGFGSYRMPEGIRILFYLVLFFTGPLLTKPFYAYGQKVGALLQNDQYGPAYGAMGAALALFAAASLAMLVSIIGWAAMRKNTEHTQRAGEAPFSEKRISVGIFRTSLPILLPFAMIFLALVLQTALYFGSLKEESYTEDLLAWGVLTGKSGVLLALPVLAAFAFALRMIPELKVAFTRRNLKRSRERCMVMLRCCALLILPFVVLFLILPKPLLGVFFTGSDLTMAAELLKTGSLCVVFYSFAIILAAVLCSTDMLLYIGVDMLVGLAVHLIALYGMLHLLGLGIYSLLYANLIFAFVLCLLFLFTMQRHLHLTVSWIRVFLAPLIGGLVMAAVCGIFAHVLLKDSPSLVTALVSSVTGFVFYFITVIVLHGATPRELRAFWGGEQLIKLARLMRLL